MFDLILHFFSFNKKELDEHFQSFLYIDYSSNSQTRLYRMKRKCSIHLMKFFFIRMRFIDQLIQFILQFQIDFREFLLEKKTESIERNGISYFDSIGKRKLTFKLNRFFVQFTIFLFLSFEFILRIIDMFQCCI